MTAIVMNTMTGAVSEYGGFAFNSVSPKYAAGAGGVFSLGGETDAGAPIDAEVMSGKTLLGDSMKKRLDTVFFSLLGEGHGMLLIEGAGSYHAYTFSVSPTGESRRQPGKGIYENYLAFGYANTAGEAFRLDRMEVSVVKSAQRRN